MPPVSLPKAGDMVAFGGQTSSNVAIVARDTTTGKLGDLIANLQVGTPGTAGNEDGLSAVIWKCEFHIAFGLSLGVLFSYIAIWAGCSAIYVKWEVAREHKIFEAENFQG